MVRIISDFMQKFLLTFQYRNIKFSCIHGKHKENVPVLLTINKINMFVMTSIGYKTVQLLGRGFPIRLCG